MWFEIGYLKEKGRRSEGCAGRVCVGTTSDPRQGEWAEVEEGGSLPFVGSKSEARTPGQTPVNARLQEVLRSSVPPFGVKVTPE